MERQDLTSIIKNLLSSGWTAKDIGDVLIELDETNYDACPNCGSENIYIQYETFFERSDEVKCCDCNTKWEENFVLTGISNIKTNEQ
jgi:hypothetical protein